MPDFPDTSYSLIQRVKNLDDVASWTEFLGIYQPVVYRMARRRGMQDADANDTVQKVFASIARSIECWTAEENEPPFRAWLATIARNAIMTSLTRQPRDRATGSSSVVRLLHGQAVGQEAKAEIDKETRQQIVHWAAEQIRSEFSQQTWEIFWSTSIEGIPIAKIAEQFGRSAGSIYVARHRVIRRLKSKVSEVTQHWEPHKEPNQ